MSEPTFALRKETPMKVLVSTHRAPEFRSVLDLTERQKLISTTEVPLDKSLVEILNVIETDEENPTVYGFEVFPDEAYQANARRIRFEALSIS
jgi:hypothetical protein